MIEEIEEGEEESFLSVEKGQGKNHALFHIISFCCRFISVESCFAIGKAAVALLKHMLL